MYNLLIILGAKYLIFLIVLIATIYFFKQIKNNNFVFALFKPTARYQHGLCWANVPVAAKAIAVYPNQAFVPFTYI